MPRLGGLGIYFGFLLGYMLYGEHTAIMNSILIGSFIIVMTGVVDDIKPLNAKVKLVGQLASALVVTLYGGILLKDVTAFGLYFKFGHFSYLVTILFILGCINCMNLIDGLDGLAGGISAIFFITIGVIAYEQGQTGLACVLTFIMLGSTLGFLLYNFYPADIFMGDSGSMFLGFMIAVITLLGFKTVMVSSIIIPLAILIIPILDTLFAIIRRKLKGESIFTPDKNHIPHKLLRRNYSQRQTVLIIHIITLLFSCTSIVYILKDAKLGYLLYGILLFALILFVFFPPKSDKESIDKEQNEENK
jgi:UDP-GlcNAc:undecaprenyl-phosphate GlcNAc-1-phosphate transferase